MNKKTKWGLVIVISAGLIGWGIYSQLPKENKELAEAEIAAARPADKSKKALNVNAVVIKPQPLTDEYATVATIMPDEEVDLSFETSGKIIEINFDEGTFVKKGELLAKVNDRQLQAQLKRLLAQLKLAEDRVFRQDALLKRDAVSQEAFEQAKTDLAILNADIDIVEAEIALTELRAPFDGVIGLRKVSVGTYASPSTIVAKLTKMAPLKVDFGLPERYAGELKKGINVEFSIDGSGKKYSAKVYAVEAAIDAETKMFQVNMRALYPNKFHELTPGHSASVVVKKQELQDAIAIPTEAITPEMGKDLVYLYKSGKAEPVEVTCGDIRTESVVQVIKGLQLGDTLITSGVMQLRRGLAVTLDNID